MKSFLFSLIISLVFVFSSSLAQTLEVASLESLQGTLEFKRAAESDYKPAQTGELFFAGDSIKTGAESRAAILFKTGTILRLAAKTSITFDQNQASDSNTLVMDQGKAHFFDREPKKLPEVKTFSVTTAVRGTEFVINASANQTSVVVLDGMVNCFNNLGSLEAVAGEQIDTSLGQAPRKALIVNSKEYVNWTFYYPDLISPEVKQLPVASINKLIFKAEKLASVGEVDSAIQLNTQASQLLVAQQQLQTKTKYESILLSQLSILTTVKGDQQLASTLADRAWQKENSLAAAISQTYAAQALGDLSKAKFWIDQASQINSDSSFVLARQAELALAAADFEKALEYSKKAIDSNPSDAYALSVYGFCLLFVNETDKAINHFKLAMLNDSSLAIARLGLGLSYIKTGELELGTSYLEQAAALEPNNAVYRSYLGKAYFESNREDLAKDEYNNAIRLDPKDPTAYLYRAYSHVSANQPIQALSDIEKSISLSNNRAVYRSSLLLDQDLAVRSASMSEVFSNLGFENIARVEAIKSINQDYTNYSAHQLLAESYDSIDLDDANLAENRIANLLAPLSFNFLNRSSSTSTLSEYNSLFDRDQKKLEVSIETESEDDIYSNSLTYASQLSNFGYLMNYKSVYSDMSGVNNYDSRHIAELQFKYQPYYDTLLNVTSENNFRRYKDRDQNIDEIDSDNYDLSLGLRHTINPGLSFIFESTFLENDNQYRTFEAEQSILLNQIFEAESFSSEDLLLIDEFNKEKIRSAKNAFQLISKQQDLATIFGAQVSTVNADRDENSPVLADEQQVFDGQDYQLQSDAFNQLQSSSAYLYNTLALDPAVDLTLAVNYTDIELEKSELTPFFKGTLNKSALSPKVGLSVYASESLTLRAAYFESLRKSSLEDRISLEPTLVGGLNQIFTDLSGAESRTYGLAADYKLPASSYIGVQAFERHVTDIINFASHQVTLNYDDFTAMNDVTNYQENDIHSDRREVKGYFSKILSDSLVANLEHDYYSIDGTDPEIGQEFELNKSSLSLRYFSPSRYYLGTEVSYRDYDQSDVVGSFDADNFWINDLFLGYKLANQSGAVQFTLANLFDEKFDYDQSFGIEPLLSSGLNFKVAVLLRF